ncbi:MAG: DUF2703 domain-containing protein [Candidatus Zixiibacteriota bacterium]|nr:MAG: DUF2703 domain-containing protein [candidate division Zixibacteria bacterium]
MKIEILYFDGCPNHGAAVQLVDETLKELQLDATVEEVEVKNNEEAVAKRFLGSPSIRVDGRDLEVEENEHTEYAMRCRVYRHGDTFSGLPDKELLVKALRQAASVH